MKKKPKTWRNSKAKIVFASISTFAKLLMGRVKKM